MRTPEEMARHILCQKGIERDMAEYSVEYQRIVAELSALLTAWRDECVEAQAQLYTMAVRDLHDVAAERDAANDSARMAEDRVARLVDANTQIRAENEELKIELNNQNEASKWAPC